MVDDDLRPLKTGQTCLSVPVCANDVASPNPTTPGRGVADDYAHTTNSCFVLFVVAVPLDVKLVNIYVRATRLLVISREANTV